MEDLTLDEKIELKLSELGFNNCSVQEGRLLTMELIVKVGAGYYISCTQNLFIRSLGLLRSNGQPSKKGMLFLNEMLLTSSNKKPEAFYSMEKYRN